MHNLEKRCTICGYDKYVELCHKKAIGTFDKKSTIAEINSVCNLAYLCPNHHKEFDLGLIELDAPRQ